ncbi:unnamed protein product [Haemonchus placei]|uniref:RRM domain-containing protein n=1 Tax=Haemonchus placei TaxID=6290 RepID=A0A0N4WBK2_HAEPC|nr:unnamed protein product [Haemonchus placei]
MSGIGFTFTSTHICVQLNFTSVGNLPYQTNEEAIGNHFSQAGHVTNVRIVYDRETGRMKGFGFCEFSDEAGAQNAVDTLNGADFNGRQLRTTEDAIGNYFSQAGNVTNVRIVYDRETGRTKGFGFCEFSDEAGAQNAVNTLNGSDFNGRSLRVNYANKN